MAIFMIPTVAISVSFSLQAAVWPSNENCACAGQGSAFPSAACFPKCGCPADSFGCTKTFTPCDSIQPLH